MKKEEINKIIRKQIEIAQKASEDADASSISSLTFAIAELLKISMEI